MLIKNWNITLILKIWLLLAIVITGCIGLLYGLIQQDLRQSADDPQIQMAEDAVTRLAAGEAPQAVVPADKVDIASSLAPYIIVFDASGKPVASSALLNGQIPTIPAGIFDYVRQNGEDRPTWQPQPGVRSAIVVTQFKGANAGFVLAGRSLREVEKREDDMLQLSLLGWLLLLPFSCIVSAVLFRKKPE